MTRRATRSSRPRRSPVTVTTRLAAAAGGHELRVWLLWAAGAVVLLAVSFSLADPGLAMLALDPELVAVIVVSSIALLRTTAAGLVLSACAASIGRIAARPTTRLAAPREAQLETRARTVPSRQDVWCARGEGARPGLRPHLPRRRRPGGA